MPEDKVFLDTNIIIYAYDISAGEKYEKASNIVMNFWDSKLGVISTQVLQEFYVNVTQKISKPLSKKIAGEIVKDLLKWHVEVNDEETLLSAIELHVKYKYSFWDSLIIQAAKQANVSLLFTEDLSDGQTIEGIKIKNPFVGITL